jgi:hypothetical protein
MTNSGKHLSALLIFATLLTACDPKIPDSEQESHALTQPTINTEHTELPDLTLLENGWMSEMPLTEDPYYEPPLPEVIQIAPAPAPEPLTFAQELAQAALGRTQHRVRYDGRYLKIAYPMGDVPADIGVCTDVVIRAYRELGVDLQQAVHEDIRKHFNQYPSRKRWGLRKPDPNIDHRRVYNLQAFFSRHGEVLPITDNPQDYQPGDLVTWQVGPTLPHIGVVLEMVSREDPRRYLIAHNIGNGPEIDDILFDFEITGHYRYQPASKTNKQVNRTIVKKG